MPAALGEYLVLYVEGRHVGIDIHRYSAYHVDGGAEARVCVGDYRDLIRVAQGRT